MRIKAGTRSIAFTKGEITYLTVECEKSYGYKICLMNPIDMDRMITAMPEATGRISYASHGGDTLVFYPKPEEDCTVRIRYVTHHEC